MIKDVMVYLDGSPTDEVRLAAGANLAEVFQAHLIGLFLNVLPDVIPPIEPPDVGAQLSATVTQQARELGDQNETALAKRMALLSRPAEIRRFDLFADQISDVAAREARSADTFVTTRPSLGVASEPPSELAEGVLLGSGRHILLVSGPEADRPFDRIVIAWNASREVAHAVGEAMPFLLRCQRVTIVVVDQYSSLSDDPAPGTNLARHLLHHGIDAVLDYADSNGRSVAAALIVEAQQRDADLIVMGGYSHSRLRERVFGGVTYDLIHQSPTSLLMAH
jgi:nucleotide-binding universal stress UspA family protein